MTMETARKICDQRTCRAVAEQYRLVARGDVL